LDVTLGLVGAVLAVLLLPPVTVDTGTARLALDLRPAVTGGLDVDVAPLGSAYAPVFDGPTRVVVTLEDVDRSVFEQAFGSLLGREPSAELTRTAVLRATEDALAGGVADVSRRALVWGMVGGSAVAFIVRRRWQSALVGGAAGLALIGVVIGFAYATVDERGFERLRLNGSLAAVPVDALTDASSLRSRTEGVVAQLSVFARNLTGLYAGFAQAREVDAARADTVRLAVFDQPATADDDTAALVRAAAVAFGLDAAVSLDDEVPLGATSVATPLLTWSDLPTQVENVLVLRRLDDTERGISVGSARGPVLTPDPGQVLVVYVDRDNSEVRAVDEVTLDDGQLQLQRDAGVVADPSEAT
jgi:hypothetical protein